MPEEPHSNEVIELFPYGEGQGLELAEAIKRHPASRFRTMTPTPEGFEIAGTLTDHEGVEHDLEANAIERIEKHEKIGNFIVHLKEPKTAALVVGGLGIIAFVAGWRLRKKS